MKALLIAEKPSLKRDIEATYKKMNFKDDIDFIALAGHILELKQPGEYDEKWLKWNEKTLPIVPDNFSYKVMNSRIYNEIKKALKENHYDYIINACDADQEGELIFYTIMKYFNCKLPVKRFWSTDTTEESIKKSLQNMKSGEEYHNLAIAGLYRSYYDWLLGMNLSRAASLKSGKTISVGRVMTPVLAVIVKREHEINNFVPQQYFEVTGLFNKDNTSFKATFFKNGVNEENKPIRISRIETKEEAENLLALKGKQAKVIAVDKKKEENYPPTLYSLTELQKDANKYFGYTASRTLKIAQQLYEEHKILSYPRTESKHLTKNSVADIELNLKAIADLPFISSYVQDVLNNPSKINAIKNNTKYVDDSKASGHDALIPTKKISDFEHLTEEEKNIYLLVAKRLLALFLNPNVTNKTSVVLESENALFEAKGKEIVDLGYLALYKKDEKNVILPTLNEGDMLDINEIEMQEKKTTAPKRYDDNSILSVMENAGNLLEDKKLQSILKETSGIGTPATRGEILDKLNKKEMVVQKGKTFYPTEFGIQIIEILKGKDITNVGLTAQWEDQLAAIRKGEMKHEVFFKNMIEYTEKTTLDYLNTIQQVFYQPQKEKESLGKCPICGANVIEGKQYFLCEKYKNPCTFITGKTISSATLTKTDIKKMLTGGMSAKKSCVSKAGKPFEAYFVIEDNQVKFRFDKK